MNEQKLLQLFQEADGEFLSGEMLSEKLSISRTAVWKQIERLRKQGYRFEAVSRRGYRLIEKPEKLNIAEMMKQLQTKQLGRKIRYYDEVESTQLTARRLIEEGDPAGTAVIAEEQTSGKGRQGRSWFSPPGKGIWMSLILRPDVPLMLAPQLTLLTAVAVCRAVRSVTGVEAQIKWPNDLLVDGRKICGILLETMAEDERMLHIIAGIGISVNLEETDFPPELRPVASSLLLESGQRVNRERLICCVLEHWEALFELYNSEGFGPIKLLWEAMSASLHRPLRAHTPSGVIEGTAEALDDSGALLIRAATGELVKLYSGDVEYK